MCKIETRGYEMRDFWLDNNRPKKKSEKPTKRITLDMKLVRLRPKIWRSHFERINRNILLIPIAISPRTIRIPHDQEDWDLVRPLPSFPKQSRSVPYQQLLTPGTSIVWVRTTYVLTAVTYLSTCNQEVCTIRSQSSPRREFRGKSVPLSHQWDHSKILTVIF